MCGTTLYACHGSTILGLQLIYLQNQLLNCYPIKMWNPQDGVLILFGLSTNSLKPKDI